VLSEDEGHVKQILLEDAENAASAHPGADDEEMSGIKDPDLQILEGSASRDRIQRLPSLDNGEPRRKITTHTFTSLFTQNTKCDMTDEIQQRDMGDEFGLDFHGQELLKWRQMWYTPKAFGYLTINHPVRRRAIELLEFPWFDRFILLTIFANCIQMAAEDPREQDPNSEAKQLSYLFGVVFWVIFAFECVVKVTALGFCKGKGTYLKDSWNRLDFVIVMAGLLEFTKLLGSSSVVLRTFRLMRPLRALRAIGRFKSLRMLVELLLGCVPMLGHVFSLIAFILFVFGILGVQLFQRGMQGRCFNLQTGLLNEVTREIVCTPFAPHGTQKGYKGLDGGFNPCPDDEQCLLQYTNPWYGYISFDNIGGAMMIIFQVMLQEDWTPIMYQTWDGLSWWTWIFYIVLNLVGPMFAIQLFLVVVASKYSDAKAEQALAEQAAVCLYEVKVGFVCATINSTTQPSLDTYCQVFVDDKQKKTRVINNTVAPVWNEYYVFSVSSATSTADISVYNWQRYGPHQLLGRLTVPVGTLDDEQEGTDKWYELVDGKGHSVEGGIRIRTQWRKKDTEEWVALPEIEDDEMYDEDDYEDEERSCLGWFQFYCEVLAYSTFLTYTTIVVILFNVLQMAIDRDCDFIETPEYCRSFKRELERINLFFTAFFTFELVVKMIGYTPMVYLKETANLFDVVIVATSLMEFPVGVAMIHCFETEPVPGVCENAGDGGISVLRSFRLLRVLRIGKLIRLFPQVQRQLKVIQKTLSTVSSLIGLMTMFILIFAILGMNVFGNYAMCELDTQDVDGIPFFREGAYARAIRPLASLPPGVTGVSTVQIMQVNLSSPVIRVRHVPGPADDWEDIAWDHLQDRNPNEFPEIQRTINSTMIVGLAPRNNFDDFWMSVLTGFQLLTTSDIGDAMYPAMRGAGEATVIYFIVITVIGNFMLFNLFVAIIITGFSENKANILKEEKENAMMATHDKLHGSPSLRSASSIRSRQSIRQAQSLTRGMSIAQSGKGKIAKNTSLASKESLRSGQSMAEKCWKWFKAKGMLPSRTRAEATLCGLAVSCGFVQNCQHFWLVSQPESNASRTCVAKCYQMAIYVYIYMYYVCICMCIHITT